ncbi:MAG: tRNA (Uracil-5-)-methyltransferase [Pyrinomonadaceae bacterium]|jgi:hypothetical protein|nr:tRNA (Uracil-5-)-methyltransferase [Pyrinomonadaceae bacterium]
MRPGGRANANDLWKSSRIRFDQYRLEQLANVRAFRIATIIANTLRLIAGTPFVNSKLFAAGISLDSVVGFDMFPQTHHVETVARLTHSEF